MLADCPPPFIKFHGSCYLLVLVKKTWVEAEKECQKIHPKGHLATVDSMDLIRFIITYEKTTFEVGNNGKDHTWEPGSEVYLYPYFVRAYIHVYMEAPHFPMEK